MKHWTDHQLAFVIARITIGINFLLHGVVRLPKIRLCQRTIKRF